MAIKNQAVAVGLAPTALTIQDTGSGPGKLGESVVVQNGTSVTVYLGGSTVTTASGFALAAGSTLAVDLADGETIYGVVEATTSSVVCLYQGA